VDLMALMGDEIDNIPGVPGIGEKTARELLQRFGSLDALYQHLTELDSAAQRDRLAKSRGQAELSRQLARIDSDVPIDVSPDALTVQEPDWRALRVLFRELEFRQLLAEVDAHAPSVPPQALAIRPLTDRDGASRCVQHVQASEAAIWCSLIGPPEAPAGVVLAVTADPDTAWVGRIDRAWLATAEGSALRAWLAGPSPKLGHDIKLAAKWLDRLGCELGGIQGDTMLAAYLLNPARTSQTLSDLSAEYADQPLRPLPALEDDPLAGEDREERAAPFGHAACAILRLHRLLVPKLQEAGLAALYAELELPLVLVLGRMERAGIALDVPYLDGLRGSMEAVLARLTEDIYRLAGRTFNVNSPKQLAQVLFEELKLPVVKRTKTGPSTDVSVLQQLSERHPLPRTLIQYRELAKLVSTYVEALPRLVDPATGRLHTSFNQTSTATGRLSSSEPNLQNIPIKTELGRSIRRAFVAGTPDGVLLAADYSQIELRILAHLSGDPQLAEAFRLGHDIHRFTASLIYGVPEAEVQPEQRHAMKAVNYGILYGMTAHGLSRELGTEIADAQAFIDAYFQRYPAIRRYLDDQIARARHDGFVQTLLGRRRYVPEVNSPDPVLRQFGERMAVNAPIQGTAADLIKRAMVQLETALRRHRLAGRMVLQVHDELVLELPRPELGALAALVRQVMEGAVALTVPLEVTLKAGPNWLDLVQLQ
jgi:DNA polymerase-1